MAKTDSTKIKRYNSKEKPVAKKGTNDQQHIIDALRVHDYVYVWEIVKWIGIQEVANPYERCNKFYAMVKEFDYKSNNNFINFYKKRLKYYDPFLDDESIVGRSKNVISHIIQEKISPTGKSFSAVQKDIARWNVKC